MLPKTFVPRSQIELMRPCILRLTAEHQQGLGCCIWICPGFVPFLTEIETATIDNDMYDVNAEWPQLTLY